MKDLEKIKEFFSKPIPEEAKEDPTDIIAMDVPLFIRMLEWAREDAETDMELHDAAERAIEAVKLRGLLSMDDYRDIVGAPKDELDEVRLVPKDQLEALATKLAAQVFSKKQNLKPAINILKKALEDSYKALDPDVEIKEEVGFLSLKDDNPFDDVPSIDIQMIDDKEDASSPKTFINFSSMYHSGDNGKMEILRNNPALQDKVMKMLQSEFQKTFRRVIHGVLGEPFGLDEETGYSKYLATPENPKGKTPGLTPDIMSKILMKIANVDDIDETTRLGEGVIYEELCPKGKAYIKKRMAAGEKSSAYLSGRAVKVCKGQMKG